MQNSEIIQIDTSNVQTVNQTLMSQLDKLASANGNLGEEIKRADAMSKVASVIISGAKTQLEAIRLSMIAQPKSKGIENKK